MTIFLLFPAFSLFSVPGLEYTHLTEPKSIHVLVVDPDLFEIRPIKALDNGIGRESVPAMAKRHGALAAVNGGFFVIGTSYDGRAAGALKIRDWISLPHKPRSCIGWSSGTKAPILDRLLGEIEIKSGEKEIALSGLNRERFEGEAILYTPAFHRNTLTDPNGEELLIVDEKIAAIYKSGSNKIPENGSILSIHKKHPLFGTFQIGMSLSHKVNLKPELGLTTPESWENLEYIVGGTPLLIHDKARITHFGEEQVIPTFLSGKHARTAIGILPTGHWIFVVVDKTGFFDGMKMDQLADLMVDLGCTEAMNLDGGGSSTLFFEGAVKNNPKDDADEKLEPDHCRRVSDGIGIFPKNS